MAYYEEFTIITDIIYAANMWSFEFECFKPIIPTKKNRMQNMRKHIIFILPIHLFLHIFNMIKYDLENVILYGYFVSQA